MALPDESLSIVEQWKKRSIEISSKSDDSIVSLLSRGIDTMSVVLNKKSDLDRIQMVLSILEYERSLSFQFDTMKNDEVRSLVYGLIESLHFTLSELTKERNQVKEGGEIFTLADQKPSQPSLEYPLSSNKFADRLQDDPPIIPNMFELIKEEPFDESLVKNEDYWGDEMEIKDEEMYNDDVVSELNYMGAQCDFENEDIDKTMHDSKANAIIGEDRAKDSLATVEVEKKKRPSRNVSRPLKFADCEYPEYRNGGYEPTIKKSKAKSSKIRNKISSNTVKKSRFSSKGKSRKIECPECETTASDATKKGGRSLSSKGNTREMECTECEYQTKSAGSLAHHLRYVHFTTLALAGLALRCDCGVETLSDKHGDKCDIANFIVVRKRDGPIQRFNDVKTTPQCVLCKMYPKTAYGYILHLRIHHDSFLSAHGIWLQCSCGAKYRKNNNPDSKHTEECSRREFTLYKIADN